MILLLLALLGCSTIPQQGTWIRIPSPHKYTNVECYVWSGQTTGLYDGPVCLVIPPSCPP